MKRGKQTCKILKEIRRQIAEANDIEFITSECQYQGDCLGTCPKCEAEVRYLEQQLERKRIAGKAIAVLGISAGILTMVPVKADAQQVKDTTIEEKQRITVAEKECELPGVIETAPEFPGGQAKLLEYIKTNLRYPDPECCISGRVIVQFKVMKDGSIDEVKVARGLHPLFDQEALKVISGMPKWNPGKIMNRPVNVLYTIPITFKYKTNDSTKLPKTHILETGTKVSTKDKFIKVRGKVVDVNGNPMAGAMVYGDQDKQYDNSTDAKGYFELTISREHSLLISYIGYKNQKIKLNKYQSPYITIVLHEAEAVIMGEVVIKNEERKIP
ncbi:TonB family protein [Bacteroides sp.]|uniref:TonB family protein n=1 Tax=Bacteroides sp. TaxID=29523 RepID=UPI00261A2B5B|nr:TonB family protein [Bacteroides sp.]MDD3037701.1 TonB family protein [Bacteroides sp.]